MTFRLVADIQNRPFWRVGTGSASECCVPAAGWSQASRDGQRCAGLSIACRALSLCVAADKVVLIAAVAVRWYLRYGLSYRDVEELLAERGVTVDHVTIYRWVQRFAPGVHRGCPAVPQRGSRGGLTTKIHLAPTATAGLWPSC